MPTTFASVIGSGFDSVGAQQFQWAQANRATDEANIGRFNQAQQVQNNWLAQASQLARQDQAAALEAQQRAESQTQNAAAIARQQDLEQKKLDFSQSAQESSVMEAEKNRDFQIAMNKQAAELADQQKQQKIDLQGQAHAAGYLTAKNNADAALEQVNEVKSAMEKLQAEQAEIQKLPLKEQNAGRLTVITNQLKDLQRQHTSAMMMHQRTENAFQSLDSRIRNQGYDITDDEIVHPESGKKWSLKSQARSLAPHPVTPVGQDSITGNRFVTSPDIPGYRYDLQKGGAVPIGGGGSSAAAPAPAPAAPNPFAAIAAPSPSSPAASAAQPAAASPVPPALPPSRMGSTITAPPSPQRPAFVSPSPLAANPTAAQAITPPSNPPMAFGGFAPGGPTQMPAPAPASPQAAPTLPQGLPPNPKVGQVATTGALWNQKQFVWDGSRWMPMPRVAVPGQPTFHRGGEWYPNEDATDAGAVRNFFQGGGDKTVPYTGDYPVAPIDPSKRTPGQIYWTPNRGPMQWSGNGWFSPS